MDIFNFISNPKAKSHLYPKNLTEALNNSQAYASLPKNENRSKSCFFKYQNHKSRDRNLVPKIGASQPLLSYSPLKNSKLKSLCYSRLIRRHKFDTRNKSNISIKKYESFHSTKLKSQVFRKSVKKLVL